MLNRYKESNRKRRERLPLFKEKADKILKEKNWRFGYVKHFMGMVEEQCQSPEAALAVAKAGLEKA